MSTNEQAYFNIVWPLCLTESKDTGVFPEIIFAQSALETGYGLDHPQNNYFGIKPSKVSPAGRGQFTIEYINGVANRLLQHFSGYPSMAASFAGYAAFIRGNHRYKTFVSGSTLSAQLVALGTSGYATDPTYAMKVGAIVDQVPELLKNSPFAVGEDKPEPPSVPQQRITAKSLASTEDKKTMTTQNLGQTILTDAGDVTTFINAHKSALNVATTIIEQLLPLIPGGALPAAAVSAIGATVNGLNDIVQAPVPVVSLPATGNVSGAAVVQPSIPGIPTALADVLAEAEKIIPTLLQDYQTGNLTLNTGLYTAGEVLEDLSADNMFAPGLNIAKDPNAN